LERGVKPAMFYVAKRNTAFAREEFFGVGNLLPLYGMR
jgi:hypothetical protein